MTDLKFALRSLIRASGLTFTVVVTLALGIGANAAIFSVVRGVLLRPLVNRDADRLIYIRQSAHGHRRRRTRTSRSPRLRDLQARVKTLSAFGDFSTIEFTMIGLGEPRTVRAGVVGGSYFDVMGLRPVMGRLLGAARRWPERPQGAAVLTYRFWTTAFRSDPGVIGKTIRLSDRPATVVGVLEPSVPYPQETEIIANVVTSPHHLDATMVEGRVHRMTELFGRLAPGVDLDAARAELRTVHGAIVKAHPEAYQTQADFRIDAVSLRDQIISPARTILLVLLAASALVFIVACSNVANLILARSVRREGELAIRAALGASTARPATNAARREPAPLWRGRGARGRDRAADGGRAGALRRALLGSRERRHGGCEPALGRRRARHRGGGAAGVRAATAVGGSGPTGSGLAERRRADHVWHQPAPARVRRHADRGVVRAARGRRHAADDALRAAAPADRLPRQRARGERAGRVLHAQAGRGRRFYKEAIRRISELPGVERVALGTVVPWRDPGFFAAQFTVEGYRKANGEEDPRAQFRTVSPGFFVALGVPTHRRPRLQRRRSRATASKVVIISQSVARRMFPSMDAVNRQLMWTDPVTKFIGVSTGPRRIVGVAADMDDENLVPEPGDDGVSPDSNRRWAAAACSSTRRWIRIALVPTITKVIRELAADQPVERAATLDDVRAEVLAPNRVNALVFGGFAGVALLIAVVGVAGVLAFSVSARTREFGIRLAIGSTPRAPADARPARRRGDWRRAASSPGAIGGMLLARIVGSFIADVADAGRRADRRRRGRPHRRGDSRVADAGGAGITRGRADALRSE